MDAVRQRRLRELESLLGYTFQDPALLERALTHRSAAVDLGLADNERLEFLGDAVLELIASEMLFGGLPEEPEGILTQMRSRIVSSVALHRIGEDLGLGAYLAMSVGELRDGGNLKRSVVANAVEAVVGALYLDGGLAAARNWIRPHLSAMADTLEAETVQDPKNRLQELLQGRGDGLPEYRTVSIDGPPHQRTFEVECRIGGESVARGSGSTKREAQRRAARGALDRLGG